MSLAHQAARGALWTMVSSMSGRLVGVLGTLVMTRFLAPDVIGEVSDATILCMTANWLSIWGFGQYAVVNARGEHARAIAWHATVGYVALGVVALGVVAAFGGRLTPLLDAPHAAIYVPGMALALFVRRLGVMPERMLIQQMNFRASGLALALGEIAYTATALAFAMRGVGGMAIVYGNLVQSVVVVAIFVRAAGVRSWATPSRLSWTRIREMLRFGLPLGVQGVAHNASRYWDNLTVSHFFGPGATGAYNMAYNLADIPAIQIGEQIALVLLPSMSKLAPERRPAALERATALLSLVIFPLAVGLGLVARPLIAAILPANAWQEVAPLLTVLACLSVFRPITWVLSAYFEAERKTNRLMGLEIAKVIAMLVGFALLAPFGLRVAATAVGIAFGGSAVAGVWLVAREPNGPSVARLFAGFARPLIACAAMAAAVWALSQMLAGAHPLVELACEIAAGAIVYIGAAFIVCRSATRDLLELGRGALRKRREA